MITTITCNVAVDKAYVIEKLTRGTVMRVKKCTNTAGGKGLNVAKVIHLCGEEVQAGGFIGGHNGAYVEDLLKAQEIPSHFTEIQGETRSCINILEADGTSTEFLEPGEPVSEEHKVQFLQEYDQMVQESSVLTISGSVPRGVDLQFYPELIRRAKAAGKKVLLDTSGALLKEAVKACPTMIKPNQDEIEDLLGTKIEDRAALIRGARQLHETGIPYVVVSLGAEGAMVVCEEGTFVGKPPKIKVVNTVGCGDSMTAAFAVGFARKLSIQDTLRYAIAVSSANAMTMATGSFEQKDMEENLKGVEIRTL